MSCPVIGSTSRTAEGGLLATFKMGFAADLLLKKLGLGKFHLYPKKKQISDKGK